MQQRNDGDGDGDGDDVRIVRLKVKMQVWAMLLGCPVSRYGRGHACHIVIRSNVQSTYPLRRYSKWLYYLGR